MKRILSSTIILVLTLLLIGYGFTPLPVQAAAAVSISPTNGPRDTSVTVTGYDFGANETITITYDSITITATASANATGGLNYTFSVPASRSGTHTITATGQTSAASGSATFTMTPIISLNRTSGTPKSSVTITGSGFGASETGITVTYDGIAASSGISANPEGSWSYTFTVPASPSGSHTIDAYGSSTPASTVPDVTFTVTPSISTSQISAASGSSVTVTGSGFGASETGITITYDGTPVASGISANPEGGWSYTFVVPASLAGPHTIDARGNSTLATTVPDITFSITAGISTNRATGAPGSSITITGGGFGVSETGITVTYDGTPVASGISANPQGGWSYIFVIPASPAGSHIIDANSPSTLASAVADVTFTVTPSVSVSETSGAPESSLTVTGAGFGAGETGITVTYDDKAITSGITANPKGGWNYTFSVPDSPSGSHSIGAHGSITSATSVSEVSFNIGAGISLNPSSGYVGETVDIIGSGFTANSPLGFTYDGKEIPADGSTTDESGSFSTSITIPKSIAGNHTIKVTDSQKNDAKTTFTMENTPPPAPTPLSPKDNARIGIVGDIAPTLKWSTITDPSGVTFTLQIDTNPDFTSTILEKTDIPGSHYAVTSAEALPRGEYYWRVKAVDGASNQSAWSQTWIFRSGLLPPLALAIILVLVLAAIGGGVYYFLVRRQRRRWEGVPIPEAEMPQVISRRLRLMEPQEAQREQPSPRRLALPQATRRGKVLSTEEMARLKVIADFAQSMPLAEPGYTANWLIELLQNSTGIEISTPVYEQLLKGDLQVHYEPTWMRHPVYQDLSTLLEGQPILQDLNVFVDAVNHSASEAILLLQEIYRDAITEIPTDFLLKGGWGFIGGVYSDALSWFLGKSLRDPSERDYIIKPQASEDSEALYLWGTETTSFAEPLIQATDEQEALHLRALYLRLRRTYRSNDRARQLASIMTQLEVQRSRLVNAFSQFSHFTQ